MPRYTITVEQAMMGAGLVAEVLENSGYDANAAVVRALMTEAARAGELRNARDAAFAERTRLVAALARLAPRLGWRAGLARTAIEGWDPEWHNCVYVDTPSGQLSWHYRDREAALFAGLPAYTGTWDGHTMPEKYARLAEAAR